MGAQIITHLCTEGKIPAVLGCISGQGMIARSRTSPPGRPSTQAGVRPTGRSRCRFVGTIQPCIRRLTPLCISV